MRARSDVQAVFVDVDNTLYSYPESVARTLRIVHATHEDLLDVPFDRFAEAYHATAEWAHDDALMRKLVFADLPAYRKHLMENVLGRLGIAAEGRADALRATYAQARIETIVPLPGAMECVRELSKHYTVGVITNGPSELQRNKMRALGVADLVRADLMLVGGELPFRKPEPALFHEAARRAGAAPEACVMVGDSLEYDVPAKGAGWKAVHLRAVEDGQGGGPHAADLTAASWAEVLAWLCLG